MTKLIAIHGSWGNIFKGKARRGLEKLLAPFLLSRRWFGGKALTIKRVRFIDVIPVSPRSPSLVLTLIEVSYKDHQSEIYVLPMGLATGERIRQMERDQASAVIARFNLDHDGLLREGVLYDGMMDPEFPRQLMSIIFNQRHLSGKAGNLKGSPTQSLKKTGLSFDPSLEQINVKSEQSNSSVIFGKQFILKMLRKVGQGISPEVEIGRFLDETAGFSNGPALLGFLEYRKNRGKAAITLALVQSFVPNEGDAWSYTLKQMGRFYEHVIPRNSDDLTAAAYPKLVDTLESEIPMSVAELLETYLPSARLLGRRTAELHMALAHPTSKRAFGTTPFGLLSQHKLVQSVIGHVKTVFSLLKKKIHAIPAELRHQADEIIKRETLIIQYFNALKKKKIHATQIRCHGDFHLGQVLYTGQDFMPIDFEGEPDRSFSERRRKLSPLKDVAGMLRSFHYAAYVGLFDQVAKGAVPASHFPDMEKWAQFWAFWVGAAFFKEYMQVCRGVSFLPAKKDELGLLLNMLVLEKAIYELGYELNNRPDWVKVPLWGIKSLLASMV